MIRDLSHEIEDNLSDEMIDFIDKTIEDTLNGVKIFCDENIPNFSRYGNVKHSVKYENGQIFSFFDVTYRGQKLENTEYSEYVSQIANMFEINNKDMGWESED